MSRLFDEMQQERLRKEAALLNLPPSLSESSSEMRDEIRASQLEVSQLREELRRRNSLLARLMEWLIAGAFGAVLGAILSQLTGAS